MFIELYRKNFFIFSSYLYVTWSKEVSKSWNRMSSSGPCASWRGTLVQFWSLELLCSASCVMKSWRNRCTVAVLISISNDFFTLTLFCKTLIKLFTVCPSFYKLAGLFVEDLCRDQSVIVVSCWPIRSQYPGQVTTIDQSEAGVVVIISPYQTDTRIWIKQ